MSSREQQKRLITRVRRSLITSSVVGSLGLAGYLGLSTPATASDDTSGTTTNSGTDPGTDTGSTGTSYADQNGGSTELSSGSGSPHATTGGS